MSRQPQHEPSGSAEPSPEPSASRHSSPLLAFSPAGQPGTGSEDPSPSPQLPQAVPSSSSEGYPSWLPKRPPPPAPRSTIHSTTPGLFTESPGPSAGMEPFVGGRKATPRSVRIVSLQESVPGDIVPSRRSSAPAHARVWSRATSAGLTATAFSSAPTQSQLPRPRFRSSNFRSALLRHPDWRMRVWFFLFPIFVLAHIPLQTFFDFNAVFMLLSVAKFPNPAAPGVPGSGRNWSLGAAAYIACWFIQVFVIFVVYELVYSFIRRWRVKRPLMLPLYLSSPAFNFVAMSSYTNFCFMYYIRFSAFTPFTSSSTAHSVTHGKMERTQSHAGSFKSGLAETFHFYSQNLPTVALLVPRAALSLALLLAYSGQGAVPLPAGDSGIVGRRDGTFFRGNGTLTGYAQGILIANAAWSAWRIMVLLASRLGLWIMSGKVFAGLCGPRYRWEEEHNAEAEKSMPSYVFSDNVSDHMDTPLPWTWRENTVYRVYDAWDFCLTSKLQLGRSGEKKSGSEPRAGGGFEGIDKVIAAVGLGGGPTPARRGVLSDDLFATPEPQEKEEPKAKNLGDILPPAPVATGTREKKSTVAGPSTPLAKLPYPFSAYPAQVSSSEEVVPFPPSPRHDVHETETGEGDDEEEDDEEEEEEEEADPEYEGEGGESEEPSSGRRTSGSMSSLGRPVVSRYPFQIRRPHTRGGSVSSASQAHTQLSTPLSHHTHSSQPSRSSRASHFTQSTGNRETSSDSPFSVGSSGGQSPLSSFSGTGIGIPMPPRHPQTRRSRAGTVPLSVPSSPSPVAFPEGRSRARARTQSVATDTSMTFGPIPVPAFNQSDDDEDDQRHHDESLMDVPEAEGSIEEAEQHDHVGLLSAGTSPRVSLVNLRHFGSNLSVHRHTGSRSRSATSRSNSRSRTSSGTSISESARSRAQSLIQSLSAAASRSSVDLVRSRANSMARLSDSPYYSTSPDLPPSSPENHTFGHPLREQWRSNENIVEEAQNEETVEGVPVILEPAAIPLPSSLPGSGPASQSRVNILASPSPEVPGPAPGTSPTETIVRTAPIGIPIPGRSPPPMHRTESQPDISTANQSFVTAPATLESRTDTSGQTPSSWGGMEHYAEGHAWKQV